jgi:hypothetical protein
MEERSDLVRSLFAWQPRQAASLSNDIAKTIFRWVFKKRRAAVVSLRAGQLIIRERPMALPNDHVQSGVPSNTIRLVVHLLRPPFLGVALRPPCFAAAGNCGWHHSESKKRCTPRRRSLDTTHRRHSRRLEREGRGDGRLCERHHQRRPWSLARRQQRMSPWAAMPASRVREMRDYALSRCRGQFALRGRAPRELGGRRLGEQDGLYVTLRTAPWRRGKLLVVLMLAALGIPMSLEVPCAPDSEGMREYQRTLNLDADHILFSLAFCARLRLFEELWEPLDVDEVTHVEPLASLARTAGPPVPIYRQSGYLCTGGRDRACVRHHYRVAFGTSLTEGGCNPDIERRCDR